MNITFLIGNGFDINLGLKTRYTDFYPYYLTKKHDDIISKAIADNYDRWADLELALGQLLGNVTPNQVTEFLDSKALLELDLAEYLQVEQRRVDLTSARVQEEFQKKVTGFYNEFSAKDKNVYLEWQKQVAATIRYQFISFNYTNTLDGVVEPARHNKQFGSHSASNQTYHDTVGGIIHLHGTVSDKLILGLDNTKQIGNLELRASSKLTNYIIKATVNEALGGGKTESAKQLIDDSDYVCVYGMSLGDTDLMWWKYLVNWLVGKNSRRLVLYIYEKGTTNPSGPEKLRQQDKWKNAFLKIAGTKPDLYDRLCSQIIVVLRSKIFDFNNIKSSSEEIEKELASV